MRTVATCELALPQAQAFALSTRLEQWLPAVDADIVAVERPDGPLAEGMHLVEVARTLIGEMRIELEVLELQPPHFWRMAVRSPVMVGEAVLRCEPLGEATRFSIEVEGGPAGLGWLLWPLVRQQVASSEAARARTLAAKVAAGELG